MTGFKSLSLFKPKKLILVVIPPLPSAWHLQMRITGLLDMAFKKRSLGMVGITVISITNLNLLIDMRAWRMQPTGDDFKDFCISSTCLNI
jgi:hypothetical protein